MQWEYDVLPMDTEKISENDLYGIIQKQLMKQGENRWELASVILHGEKIILFLKRPVEA